MEERLVKMVKLPPPPKKEKENNQNIRTTPSLQIIWIASLRHRVIVISLALLLFLIL